MTQFLAYLSSTMGLGRVRRRALTGTSDKRPATRTKGLFNVFCYVAGACISFFRQLFTGLIILNLLSSFVSFFFRPYPMARTADIIESDDPAVLEFVHHPSLCV